MLVTPASTRREAASCWGTAFWWGVFGAVGFGVFFLNSARVASPAWAFPLILCFAVPWFTTTQNFRYLSNRLPVAAALVGSGVAHLWNGQQTGVFAALAAAVLLSASLQEPRRDLASGPLSLFGKTREQFLGDRIRGYSALRWLSARADDSTRVYGFRLEGSRYAFRDPSKLVGDYFGKYRYASVFGSVPGLTFRPASEAVDALRRFGVRYVAVAPEGDAYRPGLLLQADPDLARYLKVLREIEGVLVYEFDPDGGFEPVISSGTSIKLLLAADFIRSGTPRWISGGSVTGLDGDTPGIVLQPKPSVSQRIPLQSTNAFQSYNVLVKRDPPERTPETCACRRCGFLTATGMRSTNTGSRR